jgi:hypothetical protein
MVTVALPPVDGASVRLWWPAGMGEQALYSIAVSAQVVAANGNANGNTVATPTVEATRRVGFRVVYLVTTDDANPAAPTAEGCVLYQYRGHFDSIQAVVTHCNCFISATDNYLMLWDCLVLCL